MKSIKQLCLASSLLIVAFNSLSGAANLNPEKIFIDRCSLCHGRDALGEGLVNLRVHNYPDTNLITPRFGTSTEALIDIIRFGGANGNMSPLSPPWEHELSDQEIRLMADWIIELRKNTEKTQAKLLVEAKKTPPSTLIGKHLYLSRCAICHGRSGKGDGKLANKVVKNPPPFNLQLSAADDSYLSKIIRQGGAPLGRSPQMPPWKDELLDNEVHSLVLFINTLRKREFESQ